MPVVTYDVPDISCEGCANAIKQTLSTLPGIRNAIVDVDTKLVQVDYDESRTGAGKIEERLRNAGYEAEQTPA